MKRKPKMIIEETLLQGYTEKDIIDFIKSKGGTVRTEQVYFKFQQEGYDIAWKMRDKGKLGYKYNHELYQWQFFVQE